MMKPRPTRRKRACWLALGLALGCSEPPPAETLSGEAAPPADAATAEPTPKASTSVPGQPLYDAQGKLLPSGEFLAGLRLPRGLQLFRKDERETVYRTELPLKDVLSYFGPLLMTGKVDRIGEGAVYRRASVRGAEMNPTKVDVSILPASKLTRVSIVEIPPPSKYAAPAQDTRADYYKRARMLD